MLKMQDSIFILYLQGTFESILHNTDNIIGKKKYTRLSRRDKVERDCKVQQDTRPSRRWFVRRQSTLASDRSPARASFACIPSHRQHNVW